MDGWNEVDGSMDISADDDGTRWARTFFDSIAKYSNNATGKKDFS